MDDGQFARDLRRAAASYAMGVRATEVLLARLAGDGPAAREHTLPNLVIDRESVGASSTMDGPSAQKGFR